MLKWCKLSTHSVCTILLQQLRQLTKPCAPAILLLLAHSVFPYRYHNKVLSCWHGVSHQRVDVDSTLQLTWWAVTVRTAARSGYGMSCADLTRRACLVPAKPVIPLCYCLYTVCTLLPFAYGTYIIAVCTQCLHCYCLQTRLLVASVCTQCVHSCCLYTIRTQLVSVCNTYTATVCTHVCTQ